MGAPSGYKLGWHASQFKGGWGGLGRCLGGVLGMGRLGRDLYLRDWEEGAGCRCLEPMVIDSRRASKGGRAENIRWGKRQIEGWSRGRRGFGKGVQ